MGALRLPSFGNKQQSNRLCFWLPDQLEFCLKGRCIVMLTELAESSCMMLRTPQEIAWGRNQNGTKRIVPLSDTLVPVRVSNFIFASREIVPSKP